MKFCLRAQNVVSTWPESIDRKQIIRFYTEVCFQVEYILCYRAGVGKHRPV